jgi:hypothetical protein
MENLLGIRTDASRRLCHFKEELGDPASSGRPEVSTLARIRKRITGASPPRLVQNANFLIPSPMNWPWRGRELLQRWSMR